jgi:prepilin-type N-terminal cleavage/methylation domain-containing protein
MARMRAAGFTLLELLVALVILSVVSAIVYASLSSVVNTMDVTRVDAEELRLRQFLIRSFTTNVASIHVDPLFEQEVYQFIGLNGDGPNGPADSLRFVSSAPLIGGMALPGDLKEVIYEVADGGDASAADGEERIGTTLESMETPLLGANVQEMDADGGRFVADPNYESPSWSVPIRSMDIAYFDGVEWVEEWDSIEMGYLPWCIEVSINFARTEGQLQDEADAGIDPYENPDLVLVMPIPIGVGTTVETRNMGLTGAEQMLPQGQGSDE